MKILNELWIDLQEYFVGKVLELPND